MSGNRWKRSRLAGFLFQRQGDLPSRTWRAARRGTTAIVVALFPLLFILDERSAFSISPVLPGLVVLSVLIVVLPFGLGGLWRRRNRRQPPEIQARRATRIDQWANLGRILAFLWFLAWLALGA